MEELRKGHIVYTHSFIWVDDASAFDDIKYLEAGYYASMYDQRYMSDGQAISKAVTTLMDFVDTNEYVVCGDYMEDCIAETTMFDFNRMLYVVKELVAIELDPQSN